MAHMRDSEGRATYIIGVQMDVSQMLSSDQKGQMTEAALDEQLKDHVRSGAQVRARLHSIIIFISCYIVCGAADGPRAQRRAGERSARLRVRAPFGLSALTSCCFARHALTDPRLFPNAGHLLGDWRAGTLC